MRRTSATLTVIVLTLVVGSATAFAATTTTTGPPSYAAALEARLAKEWKDPALAHEIVTGLGADQLAAFEAKVPLAEVATSLFLTYRPKPIPAKTVDSVIVYAFGNRVDANGATTAGPTNEQLAKVTKQYVAKHPVPVFAQQEVAQFLQAQGVKNVTSIDPVVGPDGKIVYLSTVGVAEQAKAKGAAGTLGVLCFADHLGRCLLTTQKVFGPKGVGLPAGVTLPSTYDTQSGQSWTRDRKTYLQTDLLGRLATL
ncbi:MAG: hypothetical protein U0W40_02795 [Acidimicrobiia bacterium]